MMKYCFDYAELAVKYLKTGKEEYLHKIAETGGAAHIFAHSKTYTTGNDAPANALEMITPLIKSIAKEQEILPFFERNLNYAKKLAASGEAEQTVLEYLPEDFAFENSTLFFTFGYDIGVGFGTNCSLNLAATSALAGYKDNIHNIKMWAIHEMHHAGFMALGGDEPPFMGQTRGELLPFIEFCTHLEGMATYAAKSDPAPTQEEISEFFEIYKHFKTKPNEPMTEFDYEKYNDLSWRKRLFYKLGGHMAKLIDESCGRAVLTALIAQPSSDFIELGRTLCKS